MKKTPTFATLMLLVAVFATSFISALRLAHGDELQKAFSGDGNSIVFAEVVVPPRPAGESRKEKIVLRPIGTLSGPFDSSRFSELTAKAGSLQGLGDVNEGDSPSAKGEMVLAALCVWDDGCYYVPPHGYRIMHVSDRGMRVVRGLADPRVAATLKAIQVEREQTNRLRAAEAADDEKTITAMKNPRVREAAREIAKSHFEAFKDEDAAFDGSVPRATHDSGVTKYWLTHSVIFAKVETVDKSNGTDARVAVVLQPKLTLAGTFDAGTTPVVKIRTDFSKLARKTPPAAGDYAIVVLQRDNKTYSLAEDECKFMPEQRGQHPAFCVVKDFSDPIVSKTINSLKAIRKAEREELKLSR